MLPIHPFSTPWKHQKTVRFSDIFKGVQKGCIGNKWVNEFNDVKAPKEEYYNYTVDKHCITVLDWMEVSIIQSEKSSSNTLKFERAYSEKIFSYVNIFQAGKCHRMKTAELGNLWLKSEYSSQLPVSSAKYETYSSFARKKNQVYLKCTMISIKTWKIKNNHK